MHFRARNWKAARSSRLAAFIMFRGRDLALRHASCDATSQAPSFFLVKVTFEREGHVDAQRHRLEDMFSLDKEES